MELDSSDKLLLQRAYAKITTAQEIMQFLSDYFRDKYGLTPANEITPDGKIISTTQTFTSPNGEENLLDLPSLQS